MVNDVLLGIHGGGLNRVISGDDAEGQGSGLMAGSREFVIDKAEGRKNAELTWR